MIERFVKAGRVILTASLMAVLSLNTAFAQANLDFSQVDLSRDSTAKKFIYEIQAGSVQEDFLKVSNTSDSPLEFKLLAADKKEAKGEHFILKGENELDEGIGSWIAFSQEEFTVPPNSSKEIKFSIRVPLLADVGTHDGGILVQRHMRSDDGMGLNLQQGVPVTVIVPGTIVKSAEFKSHEYQDLGDFRKLYYSFENTGTVSLNAASTLTVKNLIFGTQRVYKRNIDIDRRQTGVVDFDWEEPGLGMYSIKVDLLNDETGEIYASSRTYNHLFIPYLELFLLTFLILILIFRRDILDFLYSRGSKKTVNHLLILALIVGFITYVQYRDPFTNPDDFAASITVVDRAASEEEKAATYYLVAKWGHLTEDLSEEAGISMDANIILSGATFIDKKDLSADEDDELILSNADRVLNIESEVNDDFDAVVLTIQTNKNKAFNVAFEDKIRNIVHVYSIAELAEGITVEAKRGSSYTFGKADMKLLRTEAELDSYLESAGIKAPVGTQGVLLNFDSATPDVKASELNKEDTVTVLKSILSDKSATPDAKSSVNLRTDLVEQIVQSDVGAEVLASKEFISDLLASPEVLSALASTANSNVVFLPSDTIVFPKQSFSFDEQKIVSKVIGTMVFVHKKNRPWNAYVSASDFQILAGESAIAASNLSIIPGPIIPINNSRISSSEVQRGDKHRLANNKDQAILVSAQADKDAMFIMRPRLELILPPATRTGVYAGNLTITYIDRN